MNYLPLISKYYQTVSCRAVKFDILTYWTQGKFLTKNKTKKPQISRCGKLGFNYFCRTIYVNYLPLISHNEFLKHSGQHAGLQHHCSKRI